MTSMMSIAPVSVLLLGVLGMLVVAFSVLRMVAEDRRYRGPITLVGARTAAPQAPPAPTPASHVSV